MRDGVPEPEPEPEPDFAEAPEVEAAELAPEGVGSEAKRSDDW